MASARTVKKLNPHVVTRCNENGEDILYYRFFVSPIDPSAKYSLRSGKLNFNYETINYDDKLNPRIIQATKNLFNIQTFLAGNSVSLALAGTNRKIVNALTNSIVIDVNKDYFDKNSKVTSFNYEAPQPDKDFFPSLTVNRKKDRWWDVVDTEVNVSLSQATTYPVYSQSTSTKIIFTDVGFLSTTEKKQNQQIPNPLVDENNQSHVEILDYKTDMLNKDLGQDLVLSKETPCIEVGYRRTIKNRSDWCSHAQPMANRKSYLGLTKQLLDEEASGNAFKIAALFQDYVTKGQGFSALLHFHLFRHNANVEKAKEITYELLSNSFNNANNKEIALYLLNKFEEHKKNYQVNPDGSFARRMNYAIAQLTQGMCYSLNEFREYIAREPKAEVKVCS